MLQTFTYSELRAYMRLASKAQLSVEAICELQAEIRLLQAKYEAEVCVVIPPVVTSHTLAFWRAYFKLKPDAFTQAQRDRLKYARETKVEFWVSEDLSQLTKRR